MGFDGRKNGRVWWGFFFFFFGGLSFRQIVYDGFGRLEDYREEEEWRGKLEYESLDFSVELD